MKIILQGQVLSQKNSKKVGYNRSTGRRYVFTHQRVADWQINCLTYLKSLNISTFSTPLELRVKIWNKDRTRRDLDNQLTSIQDLLKNSNIISDDSYKIIQKASVEIGGIDRNNPRAEIEIIKIKGLDLF